MNKSRLLGAGFTAPLTILFLTLATSSSHAALIDFEGEMIFAGGAYGGGFGLPLSVDSGTAVSGSFDYDPNTGGSQSGAFILEVAGFTLTSEV